MKQIKTDGDLVQVAKQIDGHLDAVRNLIEDLELAEHLQARAFIEGLDENGLMAFARAEHIVHHALLAPSRWETGEYGIRRKGKVTSTGDREPALRDTERRNIAHGCLSNLSWV